MKRYLLIGLMGATHSLAGGFVNLTLDSPNLDHLIPPKIPNGPYSGLTSDIVRGWTLLSGGVPITTMNLNPYGSYVGSLPSLLENNTQVTDSRFGQYTLFMATLPPSYPSLTLEQRGTIPPNAIGLSIYAGGGVTIGINGETYYGAFSGRPIDVSSFAGKDVDLRIEIPAGSVLVDIFGFTYVPEPSTWALLGTGMLALRYEMHRRHARSSKRARTLGGLQNRE